jgi:hypothetical protein
VNRHGESRGKGRVEERNKSRGTRLVRYAFKGHQILLGKSRYRPYVYMRSWAAMKIDTPPAWKGNNA